MPGEGAPVIAAATSALKTLAQLRAQVYAPLRDTERSFVEPWFVDAMLNEAYLDLNARLRLKRVNITGTTSATGTIPLPSDAVEVMDAWIGKRPIVFHDDNTFLTYQAAGVTPYLSTNTTAILGRISMDLLTIETYPQAKSVAYSLDHVQRPAEMALDTDTPTALTPELTNRIVNYARAHAKWQEGAEAEGQRYMAMYEQGLPGAPREMVRRRPQSFMLIPEEGPLG